MTTQHASGTCWTMPGKRPKWQKGRQRQDLEADRQFCLALTHLVQIVGEAAAHVSPEAQDRWPTISWRGVVGLRNRLIHGYDDVDLDILWAIVQDDLPPLIAELRRILDL